MLSPVKRSTLLCNKEGIYLYRGTMESSAYSTHLRLRILARFASDAGVHMEKPEVAVLLSSHAAARLSEAHALRVATGNSWSAFTARRLLSTAASDDAALQRYPEPALVHFRRAYSSVAQSTSSDQDAGMSGTPISKRRKLAGGNTPAIAVTATAGTAAVAVAQAFPITASQHARPDLNSIVWARCCGYPFWPGRVVAVTATSLHVNFFGEASTQAIKGTASVLPFHHERAGEFVAAGYAEPVADVRATFVVAHAEALEAERKESPMRRSTRCTAEVHCVWVCRWHVWRTTTKRVTSSVDPARF